jgi:hypothetical protein
VKKILKTGIVFLDIEERKVKMKRIYFIIAAILFITWTISLFLLNTGNVIHCLPVIAGVFYLHGIICPYPKTVRKGSMNDGEEEVTICQQSL